MQRASPPTGLVAIGFALVLLVVVARGVPGLAGGIGGRAGFLGGIALAVTSRIAVGHGVLRSIAGVRKTAGQLFASAPAVARTVVRAVLVVL